MCDNCYLSGIYKVISSLLIGLAIVGIIIISVVLGYVGGNVLDPDYGTFYSDIVQNIQPSTVAPLRAPIMLTQQENTKGVSLNSNGYSIDFEKPGLYVIDFGAIGLFEQNITLGLSILNEGESLTDQVIASTRRSILAPNSTELSGQVKVNILEGQSIYLSLYDNIDLGSTVFMYLPNPGANAYLDITQIEEL